MNSTWVLILVISSGTYSSAVTTQEFSTQENCLAAVRNIQNQQVKNGVFAKVSSYTCSKK